MYSILSGETKIKRSLNEKGKLKAKFQEREPSGAVMIGNVLHKVMDSVELLEQMNELSS